MNESDIKTSQQFVADSNTFQTFGKIRKPNRTKADPPKIYINDRKKARYDLYTIGQKPQE